MCLTGELDLAVLKKEKSDSDSLAYFSKQS